MMYGMARLGKGTLGTQGRVGNFMVGLARTELPYQVVQPYPTLGTPVGNVVLGMEGRREVMGRVPNPLTIHCVYFPHPYWIYHFYLGYLPNPLNFANFLSCSTRHPYLNPH